MDWKGMCESSFSLVQYYPFLIVFTHLMFVQGIHSFLSSGLSQTKKKNHTMTEFVTLQTKINFQFIHRFLCEEATTFLIMERESCDYDTAMGRALGVDKPLNTFYFDTWYELLPKVKMPPMANKEARHAYEDKMRCFVETTPNPIRYKDVPWSCDCTPEDMVAVMLSGEAKTTMKTNAAFTLRA